MHGTLSPARAKRSRRGFWLKQLHTWHWVSSAISLIGLLLFAITGFTLNHAGAIEGAAKTAEYSAALPVPLRPLIAPDQAADTKKPFPPAVAAWIEGKLPVRAAGDAEWSADQVYLALPRPGGDGWVAVDRATGEVTAESTSRGWISYLNDLHKARNTGGTWKLFVDVFAGACLVFAATGLVLLQLHAARRPSTWWLVAAGLAIPTVIAVVAIH